MSILTGKDFSFLFRVLAQLFDAIENPDSTIINKIDEIHMGGGDDLHCLACQPDYNDSQPRGVLHDIA